MGWPFLISITLAWADPEPTVYDLIYLCLFMSSFIQPVCVDHADGTLLPEAPKCSFLGMANQPELSDNPVVDVTHQEHDSLPTSDVREEFKSVTELLDSVMASDVDTSTTANGQIG